MPPPGTMLSDARGHGPSPSTRTAKLTSAVILAFGLAVALSFQRSPVQLIVVAQALTVVVAPLLALLILVMSNKSELMRDMRNAWWQHIFGVLGFVSVLACQRWSSTNSSDDALTRWLDSWRCHPSCRVIASLTSDTDASWRATVAEIGVFTYTPRSA
jgi:hypothetical protein